MLLVLVIYLYDTRRNNVIPGILVIIIPYSTVSYCRFTRLT